jgi:hypothetical protein
MDKTKVLLVVVCAGLAGVLVGRRSADVARLSSKPLQLINPDEPVAAPAAPSASSVVPARSVRPAVKPAPVAHAASPSSAARSTAAPRVDARPARPAAPTPVPLSTAVASNPVTPVAVPAAPVADKVGGAEAYEIQAITRMHQGEYHHAGELFETALRNGGKASFAIVHDHSKGNFEKDPKASCVGELILTSDAIRFEGAGAADSHHFKASWAEVLDAGANRFFGSGLGGFHVAINPDGKYKNFNLAPRSKDKWEAKLIVDLLNANARKTDRGK